MSTYRVVVIGPNDEVLDTISLDGLDLSRDNTRLYLGQDIGTAMGTVHLDACAALPYAADEEEL